MKNRDSKKTICILGCGGFIGSHLVSRFLDIGEYHIIGIDIASSKIEPYLKNLDFEFVELNVYETGKVREYVSRSDVVISLVALCNPALYNTIPLDVIDANFTSPLEIVKMCTELGKWIIHFSTCEIYGQTLSHFMGDDVPDNPKYYEIKEDETPLILGPISAQRWSYASAKQLLERVIYAYGFEKNLEYTVIRPFNFIGPRMDYIPGIDGEGIPRVLACFMEALMRGKKLQLVDGGHSRRAFTYIDDAVDSIVAILNNKESSMRQAFNIGNPQNEIDIAGLAEKMIKIYKEEYPERNNIDFGPENISSKEFYGEGYEDSDRRVPNIEKAVKLLNWNPSVNLDDTLRKTIISYVNDYGELLKSGDSR